jgi:hypothetical protein
LCLQFGEDDGGHGVLDMVEIEDWGLLFGGLFESRQGEVVDESGDAAREVMNFVGGGVGEDLLVSAGGGEMMADIVGGLSSFQGQESDKESDALAQRLMNAEFELLEELGCAGKEDGEIILAVELEIGEEANEFESGRGDFLDFIEDEEGIDGIEFADTLLEISEHGAFGELGLEVEFITQGAEHVAFTEKGKGDIEDLVGLGMEGGGEMMKEEGFAASWGAGDDGEAAVLEEVLKSVEGFFSWVIEKREVEGFEKGGMGKAKDLESWGSGGFHGLVPFLVLGRR